MGEGSVSSVGRSDPGPRTTRHTIYTNTCIHRCVCPYEKIRWGHLLEFAQAEAEGHHVLKRLEAPGCFLVGLVVIGRLVGDGSIVPYTHTCIYSRMRHSHTHIYVHTHTYIYIDTHIHKYIWGRYATHHLRSSPPRSLASSTTRSIFCSAGSGSPCCGGVWCVRGLVGGWDEMGRPTRTIKGIKEGATRREPSHVMPCHIYTINTIHATKRACMNSSPS